jgi:hypothetical protein
VSVEPDHGVPPFVLTREVALIAAIAGASLLGVLGILIVLRRRRETPADAAVEVERQGGLLDRPDPEA